MSSIKVEFKIGDFVYLITDLHQDRRIVTGIQITGAGTMYQLSLGSTVSWHQGIEITKEESIETKIGMNANPNNN